MSADIYCQRCDDSYQASHFVCRKELNAAKEAERDAAFIRGASWAYEELTGALIVPASFEEQARAAVRKGKP